MLKDDLNKNPFGVPKSYFDNLPTQVQERCSVSNTERTSLWGMLKPQAGFAVGFGMLAMVAYGGFSMFSSKNVENIEGINNMATRYNTPTLKASHFAKNPFASFANNRILGKKIATSNSDDGEMNEAVMSYLASENITIDDILALE